MYRTTSVMALGLFLGLAPIGALAQTQTDDGNQQQLTQPTDDQQTTGTGTQGTDDQQTTGTGTLGTDDQQTTGTDTQPTDDQQTTGTGTLGTDDDADVATDTDTLATDDDPDVATDTDTLTTDDDVAADVDDEPVEDVIAEQDTSEMLATSLMGASVNLADESIGTVSDLIITQDNVIRGVVVGVGGFLGIGEKRVALPMERLTIQTPEPGTVELAADTTREELEEKEAFKTAAQIKSEQEAEQAQQQMDMQQPPPQ